MNHVEADSMLIVNCFHFRKFLKHRISYELDYFFHKWWTTSKMSFSPCLCCWMWQTDLWVMQAKRAICSRASTKFSIVWGTNQSILYVKGKSRLGTWFVAMIFFNVLHCWWHSPWYWGPLCALYQFYLLARKLASLHIQVFQSWLLWSLGLYLLTHFRPSCIHRGTEPRDGKLARRTLPRLPNAELSFFLKLTPVIWGLKGHLGAQSGVWKGFCHAQVVARSELVQCFFYTETGLRKM